MDFTVESQVQIDDIVGVPRNGDRFDYGSVVSVKKDTITCLLSHEPLLKKELPPILCGVFNAPSKNRLERINALERASRDLHHYLTTVGDPSLLTPPVRNMISFVQHHVAVCLAIRARDLDNDGSEQNELHLNEIRTGSDRPSRMDRRPQPPSGKHDTSQLLKDIVDTERQTAQLQTEAFIKLSMVTTQSQLSPRGNIAPFSRTNPSHERTLVTKALVTRVISGSGTKVEDGQ
ncbi:hypothetical protein GNI_116360 [Gregarina niphandrodes]|uniref:Uncharacterized protein n=1 Tax=Gregarina niphandrodes TaxID=110365 RepID=A0A023B2S8_GRENI|nr:hypothetical protein GNI_116360 [Gregarina niphandrodes]EZG55196.1 hypothetical protein GNI_116360 [Gregarina niphandrodes]|eukprot:XP_011131723.1 hypothetical protein GNI_116360 [Gregarina niphandrodes]